MIGAGERIIVPTGESLTNVHSRNVVELEDPYTGEVIANDGSDGIAILDPEGNVVASATGSDSPFNNNTNASGEVSVVDQNSDPVEGEPVLLTRQDDPTVTDERTTDENGRVNVEHELDESESIVYTVEVRGESQSSPSRTTDSTASR